MLCNLCVIRLSSALLYFIDSSSFVSDETLSQVSATSTGTTAGVYEIPARLRTLHNLVIQYASQVGTEVLSRTYARAV